MSGNKRTEDLHTLKTRQIVVQNPDGTFPPVNSVLAFADARGRVVPSRDLNIATATVGDLSAGVATVGDLSAGEVTVSGLITANGGLTFGTAPYIQPLPTSPTVEQIATNYNLLLSYLVGFKMFSGIIGLQPTIPNQTNDIVVSAGTTVTKIWLVGGGGSGGSGAPPILGGGGGGGGSFCSMEALAITNTTIRVTFADSSALVYIDATLNNYVTVYNGANGFVSTGGPGGIYPTIVGTVPTTTLVAGYSGGGAAVAGSGPTGGAGGTSGNPGTNGSSGNGYGAGLGGPGAPGLPMIIPGGGGGGGGGGWLSPVTSIIPNTVYGTLPTVLIQYTGAALVV